QTMFGAHAGRQIRVMSDVQNLTLTGEQTYLGHDIDPPPDLPWQINLHFARPSIRARPAFPLTCGTALCPRPTDALTIRSWITRSFWRSRCRAAPRDKRDGRHS